MTIGEGICKVLYAGVGVIAAGAPVAGLGWLANAARVVVAAAA